MIPSTGLIIPINGIVSDILYRMLQYKIPYFVESEPDIF